MQAWYYYGILLTVIEVKKDIDTNVEESKKEKKVVKAKTKESKSKTVIMVFLLFSLLAIGLLVFAAIKLNKKQEELDNHLIQLTYKELNKKIKNKDSFILVATRTDCSHCATYKPVLKQVLLDYNLTAYEISVDKLTDEESAKFKDIANVSGTPTTLFIENGEETTSSNRIVGYVNSNRIISRFKALGYIKE